MQYVMPLFKKYLQKRHLPNRQVFHYIFYREENGPSFHIWMGLTNGKGTKKYAVRCV